MAKSNAIVITSSFLDTDNAKTAHGLIRGTERFTILGIIDKKYPGKDAGEVLDGRKRNIPVYASLKDFGNKSKKKAKYCIIGVATKGGVLTLTPYPATSNELPIPNAVLGLATKT